MLSLDSLPEEITLQVFERLCNREMVEFISLLEEVEPCNKRRVLLERSYKRLYGGTLMISNIPPSEVTGRGVDENENDLFTAKMDIEEFISKFKLDSQESLVFKSTRPNKLEFHFVRYANGYTDFLRALEEFNNFIKDLIIKENPRFSNYINDVHHVTLQINARSILVENPASVLIAIMRVLISIAGNGNPFKEKLRHLLVISTDIGEHFQGQWNQILSRFNNLEVLELIEDMMSLNSDDYNLAHYPVPQYTSWPPQLKELSINDNYFQIISKDFLQSLPRLLEKLLIAGNYIVTLGYFDQEIDLGECMPHLQAINLSRNKHLSRINPRIFDSCQHKLSCDVRELNLDLDNLRELRSLQNVHFIE